MAGIQQIKFDGAKNLEQFRARFKRLPLDVQPKVFRRVIAAQGRAIRYQARKNFDRMQNEEWQSLKASEKSYLKTRHGKVTGDINSGLRVGQQAITKVTRKGVVHNDRNKSFYNMYRTIDSFPNGRAGWNRGIAYVVIGTRATRKNGAFYAQWQIGGRRLYSNKIRFEGNKPVFNGLQANTNRSMRAIERAIDRALTKGLNGL